MIRTIQATLTEATEARGLPDVQKRHKPEDHTEHSGVVITFWVCTREMSIRILVVLAAILSEFVCSS